MTDKRIACEICTKFDPCVSIIRQYPRQFSSLTQSSDMICTPLTGARILAFIVLFSVRHFGSSRTRSRDSSTPFEARSSVACSNLARHGGEVSLLVLITHRARLMGARHAASLDAQGGALRCMGLSLPRSPCSRRTIEPRFCQTAHNLLAPNGCRRFGWSAV